MSEKVQSIQELAKHLRFAFSVLLEKGHTQHQVAYLMAELVRASYVNIDPSLRWLLPYNRQPPARDEVLRYQVLVNAIMTCRRVHGQDEATYIDNMEDN